MFSEIFKNNFSTEHLQATASRSWIWIYFPVATNLFFARRITKQLATLKADVNLFSRLLSVSRERGIDVQNVLSCELCAVPLDLLYPNGTIRHITKSNLLNEIVINRYSLPSLIRNSDLSATVTDFMTILQFTASSKDFPNWGE